MLVKFTRAYRLTRGVDQVGSTFNDSWITSRRSVIIKGAKRKVKLSTRAIIDRVCFPVVKKRNSFCHARVTGCRISIVLAALWFPKKKKRGKNEVMSRNRIVVRNAEIIKLSNVENRCARIIGKYSRFRNENWKGQPDKWFSTKDKMQGENLLYSSSTAVSFSSVVLVRHYYHRSRVLFVKDF